jgi:hypothetical protein
VLCFWYVFVPPMRNSVEIPYNEKYHKTPNYPRQKRKLGRLVDCLERRGIRPKLTGIEIAGEENLEVIGHVADQINNKIGDVMERKFVLCFGDGGNIVFNSALLKNLGEAELENPLVVADGGTMANLAHTLKTADPVVAASVVSGETPFKAENLRIRKANITVYDKAGEVVKTLSYPWTGSVGTKIGGDLLTTWEDHPRSRNPVFNLILSIWQVVKNTVRKHGDGQPIQGNSVTTMENLGFFTFDEKYTNLEGDTFHHQSFESKFGWDAMKRIAVFSAIGHLPVVSRWAWSKDPKKVNGSFVSSLLKIADEVKPVPVTHLTLEADDRYPNLHLDGFPVRLKKLGLKKDGYAKIELGSTDKSIPVARVLNRGTRPNGQSGYGCSPG